MAAHVGFCIMDIVQIATRVEFETEVMAKERLRLPARMKGGRIERAMGTRYPAFLGTLLDIMPRAVDREESNGETTKVAYTKQLTAVIGAGAYDKAGHRNEQFMIATTYNGTIPGGVTRRMGSEAKGGSGHLRNRGGRGQRGDVVKTRTAC